mgnify:CR=1 FL=1
MEHSFMAADKREREKQVVALMISLYCRKKHHTLKGRLCPECEALLSYAHLRSDRCPFMKTKTFCSNCQVHCYKPEMREKIREVMRFAGPRMLPRHPLMVIDHMSCSIVKAIMESFHQNYGVRNYENGVQFWFELDKK